MTIEYPSVFSQVSPLLADWVKQREIEQAWLEHQAIVDYPDVNDLAYMDLTADYASDGDVLIHLLDDDTGEWFLYHEVFPSVDSAQHFADCEIGGSYRIEKHGTGVVRETMGAFECKFHTDPSHGWLQIERFMLGLLDIDESQVSSCSYQDKTGNMLFLEEDCDAGLVIEALKKRGNSIVVHEKHLDQSHWIRNLPMFEARRVVTDGEW
jgi:hypothetical protein